MTGLYAVPFLPTSCLFNYVLMSFGDCLLGEGQFYHMHISIGRKASKEDVKTYTKSPEHP